MKHKAFIKQIFSIIVEKIRRFQASSFKFQEVGFRFQVSGFKRRGFTIIEVLIAILILVTGVLGSMRLISYFIGYTQLSIQKLEAAYLSQEGIEIVKNIRDGNWLAGSPWNDNLGVGEYEGDYNSTSSLDGYANGYLAIDSDGFYASTNTLDVFQRKIEISTSTSGADGVIYVSSTASWTTAGRSYSITAEERIHNWYE